MLGAESYGIMKPHAKLRMALARVGFSRVKLPLLTRPRKCIPLIFPRSTTIKKQMKKFILTMFAAALAISSVSLPVGCGPAVPEDPDAAKQDAENKKAPDAVPKEGSGVKGLPDIDPPQEGK